MVEDYFTKVEKIKQKVRNLDFEKKLDQLKKDFKNKKISKEEYDELFRQCCLEVLDKMSAIHKEKIQLNKDHSAEPEDSEDSFLTDDEAAEILNVFEYSDYTNTYFEEFDSSSWEYIEDFEKLNNLEEFIKFKCMKNVKSLKIKSNLFQNKLFPNEYSDKSRLIIKDIACLNSLKFLEVIKFNDSFDYGSFKIDYFSSEELPNIKKMEIEGLWDLNFLLNFKNLFDLTITFPNDDEYKTIKKCDLSSLENIKKLKLIDLEESNLELISTIKNIETLNLASYIEDNVDLKTLHKYENLTSLKLEGINCKAEDFLHIKNLKNISYDNQTYIDNISIFESSKIKIEKTNL
ncbi:hypothetical protein N9354_00560 [Alphaproteobacteria bacterium]|nr:hypothetical protein [Alphaproteobacteria bacterium]